MLSLINNILKLNFLHGQKKLKDMLLISFIILGNFSIVAHLFFQ